MKLSLLCHLFYIYNSLRYFNLLKIVSEKTVEKFDPSIKLVIFSILKIGLDISSIAQPRRKYRRGLQLVRDVTLCPRQITHSSMTHVAKFD